MEVVRHQNVGVEVKRITLSHHRQTVEKRSVVAVVKKYLPPVVAAGHHMIEQSFGMDSGMSRHKAPISKLVDLGKSDTRIDTRILTSSRGKRTVPLSEFFVDYYQTAIEPGEILTEIRVPPPVSGLRWSHIKFLPRSQEDFATVGVALAFQLRGDTCDEVRLALNSVAPTILRARRAEEILRKQKITDKLISEMAEVASSETDPIDDNRGSAEYKREMVRVLVRRAATEALRKIK
jgi:hypothetical protein